MKLFKYLEKIEGNLCNDLHGKAMCTKWKEEGTREILSFLLKLRGCL